MRILLLPGDRFALIVDRLPRASATVDTVDAIETIRDFARSIGAAGCLLSIEEIELPVDIEVTADEPEPVPVERPRVRACGLDRMAVEVVGHGELGVPSSADVARRLYVSLDEDGPHLSLSPGVDDLAVVDVPRAALLIEQGMITELNDVVPAGVA